MPALVTFAEFARLKGCSKPAVSHAVKSRIAEAVVVKDGKRLLNRDLAVELWGKNTLRNNRAHMALVEPKPLQSREEVLLRVAELPDDSIPELNESRARREHYQAELAKIEVDHRRKELVSADGVKKEALNVAKMVRESLINIPDRVANLLAVESDPSTIHLTLTAEITQALERLASA